MSKYYPPRPPWVTWNVACVCGHLKGIHDDKFFGFHNGKCEECMCPKFKNGEKAAEGIHGVTPYDGDLVHKL